MYSIKQLGGKGPLPIILIVVAIVFVLGVLPLFAMSGRNSPGVDNSKLVLIPQRQNNDRQVEVSLDNTTLYVPNGATDLTGSFVISPLLPESFSFVGEDDWLRPTVVDIEYRNAEGVPYHGISFSQPVSICFAMTQDRWLDFTQTPDDFQVQYFDDSEAPFHWVSMPLAMDPERYELCTETDHLSIYALAIRAEEEIPVTGPTLTATAIPTKTPVPVINTYESPRGREDNKGPQIVPPTNSPPTRQPTQPPPPTDPPATDPPATEPPATDPPATEPPATDPPATDPPATDPPAPDPPQPTDDPQLPGNPPPPDDGDPPPPGDGEQPGESQPVDPLSILDGLLDGLLN